MAVIAEKLLFLPALLSYICVYNANKKSQKDDYSPSLVALGFYGPNCVRLVENC